MPSFKSPLEYIATMQEEEPPKPRKRATGFNSPLDDVSASDTSKAMKSKMRAGIYNRKTITLMAEQQEYIEEVVAAEIGMSGLETYRWLLDIALDLYEQGTRPEAKRVVTKTVPKKKHWTSEA